MKQFYVCNCVLYVDTESYDCKRVLELVAGVADEYAYALHDLDVDENNQLKKPHYHVVMRFTNKQTFSGLSKDLGIPENYLEAKGRKNEFKFGVRYLIHKDNPDKYQYDPSIIHGNAPILRFLKSDSDDLGIDLMEEIYSGRCRSIHDLYKFALSIGAWSEFRRGFNMYNVILADLRNVSLRVCADNDLAYLNELKKQAERVHDHRQISDLCEIENEVIPVLGEI